MLVHIEIETHTAAHVRRHIQSQLKIFSEQLKVTNKYDNKITKRIMFSKNFNKQRIILTFPDS